ncbi:LysR substrate-binding domain-containing protein [Undibacterium sp. Dicai25W]|uniref:LysR family transcriptional regulator n=1 Tax=Undibacterium sp. Dicai25W TaxID=3413034 RepID=UPI003BEF9DA9
MQTFVRVVETGSFSAVAREQAATQSAISKQVASLEKYLGVRLLVRTTRAVTPTDEGLRYFEEVRRLVAEIGEAESHLREGERALSGPLRVATSVGFGLRVLLPHVRSFMRKNPDVVIDLKLDDGFVDLVEQGIDVAVRIGSLADSSLVARRIATSQRMLVAGRNYLAQLSLDQKPPKIPQDLQQHACLVYTELRMRNQWEFSTADGSAVSVRVHGPLQTNNSEVLRSCLRDGMGICYVPDWLISDLIVTGEVVALMQDWLLNPIPIHLVSPPARKHSSKVRAFGDHMAAAFSGVDLL